MSKRRRSSRLSKAEEAETTRELLLEVFWECKGDLRKLELHERVKEINSGRSEREAIFKEAVAKWTKEVHAACHSGDLATVKRLWHPWAVTMNAVLPVPVRYDDGGPFSGSHLSQGRARVGAFPSLVSPL